MVEAILPRLTVDHERIRRALDSPQDGDELQDGLMEKLDEQHHHHQQQQQQHQNEQVEQDAKLSRQKRQDLTAVKKSWPDYSIAGSEGKVDDSTQTADDDWLMSEDEHDEHRGANPADQGVTEEGVEMDGDVFTPYSGRDMAGRESAKVQRTFYDIGYREGITAGKLSTLQQGFDEGFNLSAPIGRRRGELRGQANAAHFYLSQTKSSRTGLTSSIPASDGGMRRFKDAAPHRIAAGTGSKGTIASMMMMMTEVEKENTRDTLKSIAIELGSLDVDQLLEPDWDAKRHEDEHAGRRSLESSTMGETKEVRKRREERLPILSQKLDSVLGTVIRY